MELRANHITGAVALDAFSAPNQNEHTTANTQNLRVGDPRIWDEAKCLQAEPDTFFPEKGGSTREAKKICNGCPIRDECLEFASQNDERFGIWGGLSERERRKLKQLATVAVKAA